MNIHIITYAYSRAEELFLCLASVNDPSITWHIFQHSTRRDVMDTCTELAQYPNVHLYPYGTDRGIARSCNEGIINARRLYADVVIQMCDDITAGRGDIQRLANSVITNPNCSYVSGRTHIDKVNRWEPGSFDVCAINLKCIDVIGYFDINCWPVNFEDVDWKRRASLSGFEPVLLDDTSFRHSFRESEYHEHRLERFYKVRDYYASKWGGDQGDERYSIPFNDSKYDLTITEDRMIDPYPEYRRPDVPR